MSASRFARLALISAGLATAILAGMYFWNSRPKATFFTVAGKPMLEDAIEVVPANGQASGVAAVSDLGFFNGLYQKEVPAVEVAVTSQITPSSPYYPRSANVIVEVRPRPAPVTSPKPTPKAP
jgi:hypothetical protein